MAEVTKAVDSKSSGSKFNAINFLRQFRDAESREMKQLSAAQFMEVWEHYDSDGK